MKKDDDKKINTFEEMKKGAIRSRTFSIIVTIILLFDIVVDIKICKDWHHNIQIAVLAAIIGIVWAFASQEEDKEKRKSVFARVWLISLVWTGATIILEDFDFSYKAIIHFENPPRVILYRETNPATQLIKIIGAFEFIFLGCLLPEIFSWIKKQEDSDSLIESESTKNTDEIKNVEGNDSNTL